MNQGAGTAQFRRASRVLWRYTADGVTVLPLEAAEPFVLNGAGAALWESLREARSLEDAVTTLSARFDVPPTQVMESVRPIVEELVDRGAVEVVRSDT